VTSSVARLERAALCDLFDEIGPDEPTLCTPWTTRDLAAHLIVRERRPDAAAGIMLKPLAAHMERVRAEVARQPYDTLVRQLRTPPFWSLGAIGPLDRATNTIEFFVHHEDVRRAAPDWKPRPLSREYGRGLWAAVPGSAHLALRKLRFTVAISAPGYGSSRAGHGTEEVRLTGDPGELALFLTGRQRVAQVELTGPEELTARLAKARLGL
jgi:uncharacterized protein (TIGR03085 family)